MLSRNKLQYPRDKKPSKCKSILCAVFSIFSVKKLSCLVSVAAISAVVSTVVYLSFDRFGFTQRKMNSYLIGNPDVIIASLEKHRSDMMSAQEEEKNKIPERVAAMLPIMEQSKNFIGNPSGTDIIAVFYDYSCQYCHDLAINLKLVLKSNKNLKIILKDMPVMREVSVLAAHASIYVAEHHNTKLNDFHFKLMERAKQAKLKKSDGKVLTMEDVIAVATSLGINAKKIKEVMTSSQYKDVINTNYKQASSLMLSGTPALIINGVLYLGAMPAAQIEEAIVSNRKRDIKK